MGIAFIDCMFLETRDLESVCQIPFDKYITTSRIVSQHLRQRGEKVEYIEDEFTGKEYDLIDEFAYRLIRNWYRNEICNDALSVEGINLGELVEVELWPIFPQLIKKISLGLKVLEKFQHSEITFYYQDSELFDLFLYLISFLKLNIVIVGEKIIPMKSRKKNWQNGFKKRAWQLLEIGNFALDIYHNTVVQRKKFRSKKILIAHTNRLGEIEKFLASHYETIKFFYDHQTVFERWKITSTGGKYVSSKYILDFCTLRKIQGVFKQITLAWNHLSQQEDFRSIFRHEEILIFPLVDDFFQNYVVDGLFCRAIRNIYIYRKLFQWISPDLVLQQTDEQAFHSKIAVAVAKSMDIKTMTFQHGIDCEERGTEFIYADDVLVWGKSRKARYELYPENREKSIHIVGNPNFEELLEFQLQSTSRSTSDQLNWLFVTTTNAKNKLCSAHRSPYEGLETYNFVLQLLANQPEERLSVKLHPAEDQTPYENFLAAFYPDQADRISLVNHTNIHELLKTANVVFCSCSTVALEAVILNKPLILINLEKRNDVIGLNGTDIGVEVSERTISIEQVQEAILLTLKKDYHQKAMSFLKFHLFGNLNETEKNVGTKCKYLILKVIQNLMQSPNAEAFSTNNHA